MSSMGGLGGEQRSASPKCRRIYVLRTHRDFRSKVAQIASSWSFVLSGAGGSGGVEAELNGKTCTLYRDFDLARLEVFLIIVNLPAYL